MDAVEYLKSLYRMCTKSDTCDECPIYKTTGRNCGLVYNNAKMLVGTLDIVEQWAKNHPFRTRQSVFLERYPDAETMGNGVLSICPKLIERIECIYSGDDGFIDCTTCLSRYWHQEIDEDE